MKHLKCLREYIEALRELGEIQEVDQEVDWNLELGAITRRTYELRAPAPLFNRIKGVEAGFRVFGAPAGVSGHRGLEMCRIAVSLGLPATAKAADIITALAGAYDKPHIAPRRVATGPCKENKLLGDDVDLTRFPAPLIHEGDGGRYLNTWGSIIVRTPDGSWTNWSITRVMIAGRNTMVGGVAPGEHLAIIFEKWKALGREMPFALAIGTEPAIPFVGGMPLGENVSEADFIGGYLGEAIEVVPCETVPLDVPATAEIVIEGTFSIEEMKHEGPMGDYSGFLAVGGGGMSPVFRVSAITHRHDPILPVVASGEPIEENHTCWGVAISSQVLWELRSKGFPVTMCFAPFQGAVHTLVITVPHSALEGTTHKALVDQLAGLLFHSRAGSVIPKIILTTDDIDPTNVEEVFWALSTMCHPVRDQYLFANEDIMPLVAYLAPEERKTARGAKMIYCCLPLEGVPPERARRRSSFRHLWPQEVQDRVVKNWAGYGFKEE